MPSLRVLAAALLLAGSVRGEASGGSGAEPGPPSRWLLAIPGGGQFALGQRGAGWSWLAGTAALGGWAAVAEARRGPGELNAPLVYAQQAWVLSIYAAHRDLSLRLGETERLDPAKLRTLALAPVRPSVVLSPWVLGFAATGVAVNWAFLRRSGGETGPARVRTVSYLGDTFGRRGGAAALAGYWIPLSWGAGESEELLFRGMLQSDVEGRWGTTAGWLAASAAFGAAHLPFHGPLRDRLASVGFATIAGAWLGWRYQRGNYRLSEVIAAHVWFDLAAGLTIWLLDPAENPLGAKISFAL
jgi:membrane protease YdiL (CAAX protease family)